MYKITSASSAAPKMVSVLLNAATDLLYNWWYVKCRAGKLSTGAYWIIRNAMFAFRRGGRAARGQPRGAAAASSRDSRAVSHAHAPPAAAHRSPRYRRLPAVPHHASAGRAARAAGQAREPADPGRVAGGRRCRPRLPPASTSARRVRLLPLIRERARAQPAGDPREPAGQARVHAGAQYHRPRVATRAPGPNGTLRAPPALAGCAGRCTGTDARLRHAHRARWLPC